MNDIQFSKQGRRKGFDRYGQMCQKVKSSEAYKFPFLGSFILSI